MTKRITWILTFVLLCFLILAVPSLASNGCVQNCQENFDYDQNQTDFSSCIAGCATATTNSSQNTTADANSVYKFTANQPIGTFTGGNVNENLLGNYIKAWYDFMLAVIGIVTTIMIMWGGFKWLLARGDSSKITDAKAVVFSALSGLALALSSYTLIQIINPNLTEINLAGLKPITQQSTGNQFGPAVATMSGNIIKSTDSLGRPTIFAQPNVTADELTQANKDCQTLCQSQGYSPDANNHMAGNYSQGFNCECDISGGMTITNGVTSLDAIEKNSNFNLSTTDNGNTKIQWNDSVQSLVPQIIQGLKNSGYTLEDHSTEQNPYILLTQTITLP